MISLLIRLALVELALVCFGLITATVEANDQFASPMAPEMVVRDLDTLGGKFRFNLYLSQNLNGEAEMQVELFEVRKFSLDTRKIVLYGRDINSDMLMDIWFIPGENGDIRWIEGASRQADAWDVLPRILTREVQLKSRSMGKVMWKSFLNAASFGVMRQDYFFTDLFLQQMNLMDLEARVEFLRRAGASHKNLIPYYTTINENWNKIVEKMENEVWVESGLAVLDGFTPKLLGTAVKLVEPGALWFANKIMLSVGPKIGEVFLKVGGARFVTATSEIFARYKGAIKNSASAASERMARWSRGATTAVGKGAVAATAWTARQKTTAAIKALAFESNVKNIMFTNLEKTWVPKLLASSVRTSIAGVEGFAKAVAAQTPYILQTQTIQVVAELLHRRKEILTGSPVVIEGNLREMTQNVGYMSLETTLQSGISASMTDIKKRMTLCGVFSFTNSMSFSFIMNGNPDPLRQSVDTRWEAVVGNLQTQFDTETLRVFRAASKHNPKLRLVGMAITLVDQFAGYAGYASLTSAIEKHKSKHQVDLATESAQPQLVLVPIMSEENTPEDFYNMFASVPTATSAVAN